MINDLFSPANMINTFQWAAPLHLNIVILSNVFDVTLNRTISNNLMVILEFEFEFGWKLFDSVGSHWEFLFGEKYITFSIEWMSTSLFLHRFFSSCVQSFTKKTTKITICQQSTHWQFSSFFCTFFSIFLLFFSVKTKNLGNSFLEEISSTPQCLHSLVISCVFFFVKLLFCLALAFRE